MGTCRTCNVSVTTGRVELPRLKGHDVLTVACLPVPPHGHVVERLVRESNPPFRLEGPASYTDRRTSHISVRRAGVEPANPCGMAGLRPVRLANAQSSRVVRVAQAGVEPAGHEGLSFAAMPVCVPRRIHPAPSTGFEPVFSCVTGRRALLAAPRGHNRLQWLRWESNPLARAPKARGPPLPHIPLSSQNGRI